MKYVVVIALLALGILFYRQKQASTAAAPAPAPQLQATLTPRPASEHDWAKSTLDRAHDVAGQVKRERAANEVP
ncbi:MAG: hypothetical protein M3R59_09255 [Verrucomicrobiota bacterium]|nr:hypothetical protein [Verrucomicrobiota bacterium]